jgi:hypothetical protein
MKKLLPLAVLMLVLTSCSSPLGNLGRIFPDGSSFAIDEVNAQASAAGSGSFVLKGVRCVGTNGYALQEGSTNSVTTSTTTRSSTRRTQ